MPTFLRSVIEGMMKFRTSYVTSVDIETGDTRYFLEVRVNLGPLGAGGEKTIARNEIVGVNPDDQLWFKNDGVYMSAIEEMKAQKESHAVFHKGLKEAMGGHPDLFGPGSPLRREGDEWKTGDA